ncbi:MAG: beta-propeller domain-containing protein, partial [Pseudomonadales bacterium]
MKNTSASAYLITLFLGFLVTACSGGGDGGNTPEAQRSAGMLSKVENNAKFEAAVKRGLREQLQNSQTNLLLELDAGAPVAVSNADASTPGFTRTYTLEANVDEADIVKYTGNLLLVARDGGIACCPFGLCWETWLPRQCIDDVLPEQRPTARVQIYTSDPAAASVTPLANIDVGSEVRISGMYVDDDNALAVLGTNLQLPIYGDVWFAPGAWLNGETVISLYDLEDPSQPQQSWGAAFDGSLVESRRIGDTLYLVSRFTPFVDGLNYYYTEDEAERQNDQQLIDAVPLDDLIPKIRINGSEQVLVQPDDCYVPTENSPEESLPNGSITTITAIPLSAPSQFKSTCYTGNAQGLYMSQQALYLVEQIYDYTEEQFSESTLIHKFSLSGTAADYRGSADIAGVLGHRHSMDFRLSEHDGHLRVVTSEYEYGDFSPLPAADADHVDHKLTVLRESATEQALEVVSTLPNDARPQEIGKPDEILYGVRFFGERAYLVTFEQIDPLYVLDLSDPAQPSIAGELEVPGFSDFIHPVSDELILTLGKDANP